MEVEAVTKRKSRTTLFFTELHVGSIMYASVSQNEVYKLIHAKEILWVTHKTSVHVTTLEASENPGDQCKIFSVFVKRHLTLLGPHTPTNTTTEACAKSHLGTFS